MMEDSLAYAYTVLDDMGGELVTFIYNKVEITVSAIPLFVDAPEDSTGGRTRVSNRTLDWSFKAADLVVSGNQVEPLRGCEIIREDGRRYRIAAPNAGAAWKWATGNDTYMVVQTVQLAPRTP